jgi:hypothetical protein
LLVLMMRGIYEVRRLGCLRWHDAHTKFNKDRFRQLKVVRGWGIHRQAHKQTHRQQGDLIILLLFFQNKESRLKRTLWYEG